MRGLVWRFEKKVGRRWPLVVWCGLIFLGSSLPSARVSADGLVDFLAHKIIHLIEYGVLGLLARRAFGSWPKALVFCFIYGASDEFHQLFVPGRQGKVRDVVVDAIGAAIGIGLYPIKYFVPGSGILCDVSDSESAYVTESAEETKKLGERIAGRLRPGMVLALSGDLGSGKTTFIQGVLRGLGYSRRVLSPSFVLARQYRLPTPRHGITLVNHLDCYRLEKLEQAATVGLADFMTDPTAVTIIEWAERVEQELPLKAVRLKFSGGEGERHQIAIEGL
ncbi:MAG: tRNA (adenosine(37)-N6)-threonylcarbamoyltransferase complex ATPase subunit type 1 TsaE [bacterium]|nr:tRNA (adenosine(37)-N6)-threonylcarbamoyltransferase complex ATPase subunit type 1 TsaE [bacterium]